MSDTTEELPIEANPEAIEANPEATDAVSEEFSYRQIVDYDVSDADLEALYATDVLNDAEQAQPLRRKQTAHFGSIAA